MFAGDASRFKKLVSRMLTYQGVLNFLMPQSRLHRHSQVARENASVFSVHVLPKGEAVCHIYPLLP